MHDQEMGPVGKEASYGSVKQHTLELSAEAVGKRQYPLHLGQGSLGGCQVLCHDEGGHFHPIPDLATKGNTGPCLALDVQVQGVSHTGDFQLQPLSGMFHTLREHASTQCVPHP